MSCARITLMVVNFVLLIASLLMVALGIALAAGPQKVIALASKLGLDFPTFSDASGTLFIDIIQGFGIFMIFLGLIIVLVSAFGFFGACTESSGVLLVYAVILILVVLGEIAMIIFAAVYSREFRKVGKDAIHAVLRTEFKSDIRVNGNRTTFDTTGLGPVDKAWMLLQFKLQCCGANNYKDYSFIEWTRCGPPCPATSRIPVSCCKLSSNTTLSLPNSTRDFRMFSQCMSRNPTEQSANLIGCTDVVIDETIKAINEYSAITIAIVSIIIATEVLLIVLSFFIWCVKRNETKTASNSRSTRR